MAGSKKAKLKKAKAASTGKKPARKAHVSKGSPSKTRAGKSAGKPGKIPLKGVARKTKPATKGKSLGRPRFPAETKLELVFQKDYQAREVFEFLGVETVRELEAFCPAEIVEKLTAPMVQTVDRIRKTLALSNRCLASDLRFALDFQARLRREL